MARALFRYTVKDLWGNVVINAAVNLYRPGTTTAVYGTMYDSEVSGSAVTNPLLSNGQGEVIAYLDTAQVVDVNVTDNSHAARYTRGGGALTFSTFTEASVPIHPGPSTSLAVGATPSSFAIENHVSTRNSFVVQGDNGDGGGNREWFAVENSNPGPNDLNFRNVVLNIGDTSNAVQLANSPVTANFTSPTGATGQYIRVWAPGVTNTNPAAFSLGVNGNVVLAVGGLSSSALQVKVAADSQAKLNIDEAGAHNWGPGGSTATDTVLSRSAANVLSLGSDDAIKTGAAVHASLPSPGSYAAGAQFYCTTDKKPVWSDGSAHWVDAAGANHT